MSALTLPDLPQAIDREHQAAISAARRAVEHAIACGQLLLQAKAEVGHGGWLPWLQSNCKFGQRTAQGYMRLAREIPCLDPENAQRVADLSLRDALGALATQSSELRRLPQPKASKVLDEAAHGERLRDSLVRAVNEQKRIERQPETSPSEWTTVALLPPGPPPQSLPPHDSKLANAIISAIVNFQMTSGAMAPEIIMETLNHIYCLIQDGTLTDLLADPQFPNLLAEVIRYSEAAP
jgi:hypothetical protein